tara:strand:- start:587 stop:1564 length:978 start_codon:yes stop_codon:yes gene_type:complete
MKNVLITGGLGFAGSILAEFLLKKGFKVLIIDKILFNNNQLKNFKKFKNFKFYKIDILNESKVKSIFEKNSFDIVIHLASIVGDPACKVNPKLTYQTNLIASKKIFNLCNKYKVDKFLFFSTCSNYGLSKNDILLKETDTLKPLSLYAETKVKFEKFLINNKSNVKKIILRISTLYGISPRMRFDLTINEFAKKIFKKDKFDIYHADTWRPYLNLSDLGPIIYKILNSDKVNKNNNIFNVGYSSQNFTKRQIAENIEKVVKQKRVFSYVDNDHFDKRNYKVNFSKIKKIGIKKNMSIKKGIEQIIKYLKKNKSKTFNGKEFYNHK